MQAVYSYFFSHIVAMLCISVHKSQGQRAFAGDASLAALLAVLTPPHQRP